MVSMTLRNILVIVIHMLEVPQITTMKLSLNVTKCTLLEIISKPRDRYIQIAYVSMIQFSK
jgi:hypothetical protein